MGTNLCECGFNLTTWNMGGIDKHMKSKPHQIRLKYKDIIVDSKITCKICNLTVSFDYYDKHCQNKLHLDLVKENKIKCIHCKGVIDEIEYKSHEEMCKGKIKCTNCFQTILISNYEKHKQSKSCKNYTADHPYRSY